MTDNQNKRLQKAQLINSLQSDINDNINKRFKGEIDHLTFESLTQKMLSTVNILCEEYNMLKAQAEKQKQKSDKEIFDEITQPPP